MRQKSKQLHIKCYFECYTSVEFIFNDLKLAAKLNNTTTTLKMEILCYCIISICVCTAHLCMTDSIRDISCKALDF